MSGKGDDRRPLGVDEKTFADNWERIFKTNAVFRADIRDSKTCDEGAEPSTAAIYVDDETGIQVTESWWPGDEVNLGQ